MLLRRRAVWNGASSGALPLDGGSRAAAALARPGTSWKGVSAAGLARGRLQCCAHCRREAIRLTTCSLPGRRMALSLGRHGVSAVPQRWYRVGRSEETHARRATKARDTEGHAIGIGIDAPAANVCPRAHCMLICVLQRDRGAFCVPA